MNARVAIAALPVVVGLLAYGLLETLTGSGASMTWWYVAVSVTAKLAALVGCGIAAAQFDPGDYMRRAWIAMGFCYVLLSSTTLLFSSTTHLAGELLTARAMVIATGVMVGLANLSTIVGELLVARTWRAAGMDFQVSAGVKVAAMVGSLVLALGIAGGAALLHLREVLGGNVAGLSSLCSAIGDIVSLAVLAPILLTALSLRGGSLAWPWSMLAVGCFAWVLYDGTSTVAVWMHLDPTHVRPLTEAFRDVGCLAYLSAGLLQRAARLEVAAAPSVALG